MVAGLRLRYVSMREELSRGGAIATESVDWQPSGAPAPFTITLTELFA